MQHIYKQCASSNLTMRYYIIISNMKKRKCLVCLDKTDMNPRRHYGSLDLAIGSDIGQQITPGPIWKMIFLQLSHVQNQDQSSIKSHLQIMSLIINWSEIDPSYYRIEWTLQHLNRVCPSNSCIGESLGR